MTARKAETGNKSTPASTKKTPPARKSAVKTPLATADSAEVPKSTTKTPRASASKINQAKSTDITARPDPSPQSRTVTAGEKAKESTDAVQVTPQTKAFSDEKAKESAEAVQVTPQTKISSGKKGKEQSDAIPVTPQIKVASGEKDKESESNEAVHETPQNKASSCVKEKESNEAVKVAPQTKPTSASKTTKRVVKRVLVKKKTPTSAKAAVAQTSNLEEFGKVGVDKKEEVADTKQEDPVLTSVERSAKHDEPTAKNADIVMKDENLLNVKESAKKKDDAGEVDQHSVEGVGDSTKQEDLAVTDVIQSPENLAVHVEEELARGRSKLGKQAVGEETDPGNEKIEKEGNVNEGHEIENAPFNVDACDGDNIEDGAHEKHLMEDDVVEHDEEDVALEEECAELNAVAKERRIKKELEIFVGGLDRDAAEDDIKKVFEYVGEVVEVRLHKDPLTNKNKGYAFVKFATKEQASHALLEMKNPVIHGKRCGTAPSEDNDTLFLGNICNTWTKEAVKQKLKDYGIEGVENITLVPDAQHEGLSRGFAFLEFSCHNDAMIAYKRLQKPDVIFGHPERTAKVAFAEPLREPDPEVMAQVKSVFVDGLPPHWDENHVRERFKIYGEIERITLARNMSTSKRKDFGFVDFTTHEEAVSCIDCINNTELVDGNSKLKVKARLSNPLPKTQAVKGGMSGGFRIGRVNGRGFGRAGHLFGRGGFQRGRGFYQRGRGRSGRIGFVDDYGFDGPYSPFPGRQRGRRWDYFRGESGGLERHRFGAAERGRASHMPVRRQRFLPEEQYDRPFFGRHFDDPYFYDDRPHGVKRPFFVTDQVPDYMEPSRLRPRLDYSDPAMSIRGTHYQDAFGSDNGPNARDYYGSDYGGGAYPSFYVGDRPYGSGYYY